MDVMILLLDQRGDKVKVTDEVVKAAAGNDSGKEVMTLLLDQRGDEVKITDEVVQAAAGNDNGKEVMTLLLDRRGDEVKITDEVVKAAAENYSGKEIITLLLDQRGEEVKITEEVVKAAAGNEDSGKEVITLILDQRGDEVKITDEVVKAAATSGQESFLILIEKRLNVLSSKEQWFTIAQFYNAAKAGDTETIRGLLSIGIEPDLKNARNESPLWTAASRGNHAVVAVLLDAHAVDINSKSISGRCPIFWAAARGYDGIVKMLLERNADPSFADEDGQTPLSKAKQNRHYKIVRMINAVGRGS
jgi:hypothetical protein